MRLKKINYFLCLMLLMSLATPVFAVVMSSTNYQIDRDSINFSGGASTSTTYGSESTIGEFSTGPATSTTYVVQAGYQQMDESWVSLSVPVSANLTPSINAATGGSASTSVDFAVTTNNSSGYTMQMKASTSPALKGSAFDFSDYSIVGVPDYSWSVASSVAEFGFTPEGSDIIDRFRDDGVSACNQTGGINSPGTCWDAPSTTYATISQSNYPNNPNSATTTLKFRAEAGVSSTIGVGSYVANMIVIAYTN